MKMNKKELWNKFKKAESKGQFKGLTFEEHIQSALDTQFISQEEADKLTTYNAKRFDSMLTDIFDTELNQTLDLENPHLEGIQSDKADPNYSENPPSNPMVNDAKI